MSSDTHSTFVFFMMELGEIVIVWLSTVRAIHGGSFRPPDLDETLRNPGKVVVAHAILLPPVEVVSSEEDPLLVLGTPATSCRGLTGTQLAATKTQIYLLYSSVVIKSSPCSLI